MACNLLKGKKGLIFGALNEQSIAWKVAERAVEEGAEIVLTNTAVSIRMGTINQLAEKCHTIVVPADATSVADLENLIDKTMEHFGGKFDFMLHSIGMSSTRPFRWPARRTPSTSGARSWPFRTSPHSAPSTATTTWPTPRRCSSRSPAASATSTGVRSTCASIPSRSRRRRPRPEAACWVWAT